MHGVLKVRKFGAKRNSGWVGEHVIESVLRWSNDQCALSYGLKDVD